jgi:hypothetical protein
MWAEGSPWILIRPRSMNETTWKAESLLKFLGKYIKNMEVWPCTHLQHIS